MSRHQDHLAPPASVKGILLHNLDVTNSHELFGKGISLGDVFTLVYRQPWRDNLICISVGCEDEGDIIAELEHPLSAV